MYTQTLSITEKRTILASMIRGQRKAKRYVKQSGRVEEIEEDLSAAMLLRAIALDIRLAAQEKKEQLQQAKQNNATPVAPQVTPETPQVTATPGQPQKQESYKEIMRRKNQERLAKG